jgi:hypothetical protein
LVRSLVQGEIPVHEVSPGEQGLELFYLELMRGKTAGN